MMIILFLENLHQRLRFIDSSLSDDVKVVDEDFPFSYRFPHSSFEKITDEVGGSNSVLKVSFSRVSRLHNSRFGNTVTF